MMLKNSTLALSCAATFAALALSNAPAAAQQRTSEVRVQELIREAARIAAGGQTSTPTTAQLGGQTTAPASGPKIAADARRCGEADARAQSRYRRAAPESGDQRSRGRDRASRLLPEPDVDAADARANDRVHQQHRRRCCRGGGHQRRGQLERRPGPESPVGRRQLQPGAEQHAGDLDIDGQPVQPVLHPSLVGAVHAAAPAQLRHGFEPAAASSQPGSTATSPTCS